MLLWAYEFEFGGPWGAAAMMLGFPAFIVWLWLGLTFNAGQPFLPLSLASISAAYHHLLAHATPTLSAAAFHVAYTAYQWALAQWLPGPLVYGPPAAAGTPADDPEGGLQSPGGGSGGGVAEGRQEYVCNAPLAWFITLGLAAVLHATGVFDLVWLIDNFGPLMTTGILLAGAASAALYVYAAACAPAADAAAASGSPAYDAFVGILLHPRAGRVHLKLLYDVRIPWALLFLLSASAALRQHRTLGHVTPELAFMVLAHFLYANATHKGEEHVPCTWDMTRERFGFMLLFWNAAGIPFSYSATTVFLVAAGPLQQHWAYVAAVYALLLAAYYVWDTANCQKSVFKAQLAGTWEPGRWRAPPQLPWSVLEHPEALGGRLLVSGWWGWARKATYTADLAMALSWGLIAGAASPLPYWYPAFFTVVLVHRVTRNEAYCAAKYGALWEEYCARVPYCFFPGII